jgi:hypothetical protein
LREGCVRLEQRILFVRGKLAMSDISRNSPECLLAGPRKRRCFDQVSWWYFYFSCFKHKPKRKETQGIFFIFRKIFLQISLDTLSRSQPRSAGGDRRASVYAGLRVMTAKRVFMRVCGLCS